MKLGGIAGQIIPLLFQWISYGASTLVSNINVLVDLNGAACKSLDQIRSVYIDNLNSEAAIYVYFPDTGYTIAAKPNSCGWYPTFTNQRTIWVVGENFVTGSIPQTLILVSNVFIPPSVNVEQDTAISKYRASAQIQVPSGATIPNANFAPPSLGDQTYGLVGIAVTGAGIVLSNIWNSPFTSGFIYIKSIRIFLYLLSGAGGAMNLQLEGSGTAGVVFNMVANETAFAAPNSIQYPFDLLNLSGADIKLDATQTYRLRVTGSSLVSGAIGLQTTFSTNPN